MSLSARAPTAAPSPGPAATAAPGPAAATSSGQQPLRVALFSGNYNYVRDGANQSLNRLVAYLLRQGAAVRIYSPTVAQPAFPPAGELVSLPSLPIPGRAEYRLALGLSADVRADLDAFAPNIVHVSSPDPSAHRAVSWARARGIPVLASVHTRFDTYPRYYHLGWTEPLITAALRRFYRRCNALVAPSESFAQVLRDQRMNYDISIWSRGVERDIFDPQRRDMAWRRSLGIADHEVVIGFFSRLVMEKGLDVFADAIDALRTMPGHAPHRILIVGEGPAREWLAARLPDATFTGFLGGTDLARAVASMDLLFFPSITETFGNVTLEAMASGLPVVAADATGSNTLVLDHRTGRIIPPTDIAAYAEALATYITNPALRTAHGTAGELRSREYAWDRINQTVMDKYIWLLAAKAEAEAKG